jgi:ATP-dependent RNA helicase HrpB
MPPRPIHSGLPVDSALPDLLTALSERGDAVLQAPPGAGKTTIVPLALLDADWLARQRIIMLEPRRLAARAAAHRMAYLLGDQVGATVGYRIRLDSRVSASTRIEVVTEGILGRMLLSDPTLDGYGIVIFDEFHERSLHADAALALTLHTKRLVRSDLRVLVMSATLDGARVAKILDDAPVITSGGRQFPVETRYGGAPRAGATEAAVTAAVHRALRESDGDVLVFLPGAPEIHRLARTLESDALPPGVYLAPLFGMLSGEEQDRAILASAPGHRKVVLATSIAETSLTIEGVRAVIDSGLARLPRFSPRTGMTHLRTVRVSRAAADQRRGRAGRVAAGICYRLWDEHDQAQLLPFAPPEILEGDLVPLALDLAVAGVADPLELTWLDPPPAAAYKQALELLRQLAAVDGAGHATDHGRRMAAFGAHPRLSHMILHAAASGLGALACDMAALLGERDLFHGGDHPAGADIRRRLDVVRDSALGSEHPRVAMDAVRRIRIQAAHWRELSKARPNDYDREAAGRVLALAYPDRVAQRRHGPQSRYLLRNGLGAVLREGDSLSRDDYLVIAESDGKPPESRIFLAAPISIDDIETDFADQIRTDDRVDWDDDAGLVSAKRLRMLGTIVLTEQSLRDPDPEAVAAAIGEAARRRGLAILPWTEEASRLRERLATLHHLDSSWPDMSDEGLISALFSRLVPPIDPRLRGDDNPRSVSDLRRIDVREALLSLLSRQQRANLERLAPTHYVAPTGSRIPIDYTDPAAPTVSVRLQEMFGCANTPSILGGRVPVTLHLLSPAHRPVQVTRDLAGFWRNSYFDVRKDLRGRYPKHHWPDDPMEAKPTARAKRGKGK